MIKNYDQVLSYYKLHSKWYDSTRALFLFGRSELAECLNLRSKGKVLEVGSGTGFVTALINNSTNITALDISPYMSRIAKHKLKHKTNLTFSNQNFFEHTGKYDTIIFSYSITMMPENFSMVIEKANKLLNKNGRIAVVDFDTSQFLLYHKFMKMHNINLDGKLLRMLEKKFNPETVFKKKAYLGIWNYFIFIGQKKES